MKTQMFIPINDHEKYEILNERPFTIRNRSTKRKLNGTLDNNGYKYYRLDGHKCYLHRLIGDHFITNGDTDKRYIIDHYNRNRNDFTIDNLHWVDASTNAKNKSSHYGIHYDFVNELPNDAIKVTHYNEHLFDDLYYFNDNFYYFNGYDYRVLRKNMIRYDNYYVYHNDIYNKPVCIYIDTFKRLYRQKIHKQ